MIVGSVCNGKYLKKPFDDTWILKCYANRMTGEKDLSKEKIAEFLETINANWYCNVVDFEK